MLAVTNNISVYLVVFESINAHFNEYSVSQYMYNSSSDDRIMQCTTSITVGRFC